MELVDHFYRMYLRTRGQREKITKMEHDGTIATTYRDFDDAPTARTPDEVNGLQKRRQKVKGNKQQALNKIKKAIFIESIDSYCDEYEKWKTTNVVKRLIGIFEVPAEHFNAIETSGMLAYAGLSHCTVVKYESEFQTDPTRGVATVTGTGCACALRDQYGRINPAVFIRKDVIDEKSEVPKESRPEFDATVRLLVLMHELGHAEDIVRQINFNNETRRLNVLDAEVYAHRFVCESAKRMGYHLLLATYLDSLEKSLISDDEITRWAAERAMKELDMADLREAARPLDMSDAAAFKKRLEACGRYEEVMRKVAIRDEAKRQAAEEEKRRIAFQERIFVDVLDSYEDEITRWKTIGIVPDLVGVYDLSDEAFYTSDNDERMRAAGCPFPVVDFNTDVDNSSNRSAEEVVATGFATAVRDDQGRIRPVIAMRSSIKPHVNTEEDPNLNRLIVLMHEMGHAEDIALKINYNHDTLMFDVIATEVYAHEFVCRHAKRLNYRGVLLRYMNQLNDWVATGSDVQRISAEQALQRLDIPALKEVASLDVFQEPETLIPYLKSINRYEDFLAKYVRKPEQPNAQVMSDEFEWIFTRPEKTRSGVRHFDVRRAKQIIAASPRKVEVLDMAANEAMLRDWMRTAITRDDTDWAKVNLDFPLIVVSMNGEKFPIDGRHRMRKALNENAPYLNYVELTEQESKAIRFK